jgi:muramoyltetrapeptide carboxypeptidase
MIRPPYLQKGDTIGITAPASVLSENEITPAVEIIRSWGLHIVFGKHLFSRRNSFAGTDNQRAEDFQRMLDDAGIRAILCARGGYGTIRMMDMIRFGHFLKHPKWIVGYSDITVLHSHIQRHFGIETIHAIMPVNITEDKFCHPSEESLRKALFGEKIFYTFPVTFLSRTGLSEGTLTGGNLSILYSLLGSLSEPDTNGKILFLEDLDEYLYHIDRMMINLKRAGKLKNLKGLVIGGMDRMKDNEVPFGKTAFEIIAEAVAEYDYPVYFDFPAGHGEKNLALIMGRNVALKVDNECTLAF